MCKWHFQCIFGINKVNYAKNNDHTCLFHCINTCQFLVRCSNTWPSCLKFKQLQMLLHEKTCFYNLKLVFILSD